MDEFDTNLLREFLRVLMSGKKLLGLAVRNGEKMGQRTVYLAAGKLFIVMDGGIVMRSSRVTEVAANDYSINIRTESGSEYRFFMPCYVKAVEAYDAAC